MSTVSSHGGVIAVINDLIFETKIRSTAASFGVSTFVVRSVSDLPAEMERVRPALLLIDLNTTADQAVDAVTIAHEHPSKPYVVAFLSHVDQELAERARLAGADEIMPRSRFNHMLPELLKTRAN